MDFKNMQLSNSQKIPKIFCREISLPNSISKICKSHSFTNTNQSFLNEKISNITTQNNITQKEETEKNEKIKIKSKVNIKIDFNLTNKNRKNSFNKNINKLKDINKFINKPNECFRPSLYFDENSSRFIKNDVNYYLNIKNNKKNSKISIRSNQKNNNNIDVYKSIAEIFGRRHKKKSVPNKATKFTNSINDLLNTQIKLSQNNCEKIIDDIENIFNHNFDCFYEAMTELDKKNCIGILIGVIREIKNTHKTYINKIELISKELYEKNSQIKSLKKDNDLLKYKINKINEEFKKNEIINEKLLLKFKKINKFYEKDKYLKIYSFKNNENAVNIKNNISGGNLTSRINPSLVLKKHNSVLNPNIDLEMSGYCNNLIKHQIHKTSIDDKILLKKNTKYPKKYSSNSFIDKNTYLNRTKNFYSHIYSGISCNQTKSPSFHKNNLVVVNVNDDNYYNKDDIYYEFTSNLSNLISLDKDLL